MKRFLFILLAFISMTLYGQENLAYQKPPQEILDLVDIKLAPLAVIDNQMEVMILRSRDQYKSIEELSEEELRLGGLRINPKTNIGSRVTYFNNLEIMDLTTKDKNIEEISGMPENPRLANMAWSPGQKMLSMTHTTNTGVEAWVLDIENRKMIKLTGPNVNANIGDVINWMKDGQSILVKMLPKDKKELIDEDEYIPSGPTISVNDGKKAQNRTYQDLLKNQVDEDNFEALATSEIHQVTLDGEASLWLPKAMYRNIDFSPDGNYIMVSTIEKPFSYLVPYYRFPTTTSVYSKDGKKIETILKAPLVEDLPQGFMAVRTGRRNIAWRADKPSTLYFTEALDEGDPENEVPFRDAVYQLDPPFNGKPSVLLQTINRFSNIYWGDEKTAIAIDYWWNTRNIKSYVFNPSNVDQKPRVIEDRNYQDRYNDPGSLVTKRNEYGKSVLDLKGDEVYLLGDGFSKEGQFPFLDKMNLKTEKTTRLYQSKYTDKIEDLRMFDSKSDRLLIRIESQNEYPNYFFRNLKNGELEQITTFKNPFQSITNVEKEVITYKREDGVELSGTLYLPPGYDKSKKEKLPMILWAYPREFKDKSSAGQKTNNPNEFTYPYYGSPVYWLTRGYVILDDAAFPIVGEGDEEPNDSFRKQLVANAKAAIDAVDELGYIDRNKVACGGHSYGAFMVANLLSHSDLFAAGIARSGAYNRTLTPFGFQSEERNYWEAPEVYYNMSPFSHADKMKTPLLLIHGEADNNSGTYPLQSERYFNALKGLGATVRLVMLPKESHGYRAKESILHLLWEQDTWLEKYVKNPTQ